MFESLAKKQLQSIARHALTALGTLLVAHQVVNAEQAEGFVEAAAPIVVNGVPILVSLAWTWYDNRKTQKTMVVKDLVIEAQDELLDKTPGV
jgi:hypothetical protein